MTEINQLIESIHSTPHRAVVAVAGAGSQGIAWLLGVSGASRTLLEVLVPYGRLSMIDFLGREPDQYVSAQTARDMAKAAHQRGMALREDDSPVVGLACTATIATDRTKRGDHRGFIAAWDEAGVRQYDLVLEKGARERWGEEELLSKLLVQALAQSFGIEAELDLGLTPVERPIYSYLAHPSPLQRLISGEASTVLVHADGGVVVDGSLGTALLPGSFSPLHHGQKRWPGRPQKYWGPRWSLRSRC